MAYRFAVAKDQGGAATWRLYAENGAIVAWAGESFASDYNARRAAEAFKFGAASARYEVYLDAGQKWRWRAWRGGNKVASSGESFSSNASAKEAAERVQGNTGGATGP